MPNNIAEEVAKRFVDLALRHKWDEVKKLPADDVQTLFDVVSTASFDPGAIKPGRIDRPTRNGDGDYVYDVTYRINKLCPFKVVDQKGEDFYFATGWLDCLLQLVVDNAKKEKDRDCLIELVAVEIERSQPLPPIQLTRIGDMLREITPGKVASHYPYLTDHERDDSPLNNHPGSEVGVHRLCGSCLKRYPASDNFDVIVCPKCCLRVSIPKTTRTYGELREALASSLAKTTT